MSDRASSYSPLAALAWKALLWVGLPVGLVLGMVYGMATYKTPNERFVEGWKSDTKIKIDKSMEANRAATELLHKRAASHPDAERLEAELSKLTPDQRAKRIGELMEEYAKKVRTSQ